MTCKSDEPVIRFECSINAVAPSTDVYATTARQCYFADTTWHVYSGVELSVALHSCNQLTAKTVHIRDPSFNFIRYVTTISTVLVSNPTGFTQHLSFTS